MREDGWHWGFNVLWGFFGAECWSATTLSPTRRGKAITGNKKDLAARAPVSFESKDPIADCPEDISDHLEREYNSLLKKGGFEDPRDFFVTSLLTKSNVGFGARVIGFTYSKWFEKTAWWFCSFKIQPSLSNVSFPYLSFLGMPTQLPFYMPSLYYFLGPLVVIATATNTTSWRIILTSCLQIWRSLKILKKWFKTKGSRVKKELALASELANLWMFSSSFLSDSKRF